MRDTCRHQCESNSRRHSRGRGAFTIAELLVVMAIIAVLATIGLPALKGFGKGTAIQGAQRQLLDDLGQARLRAISSRTTVYVVFTPTNVWDRMVGETDQRVLRMLTNLVSAQYTGYAIVSKRSVGDQPGRDYPRYLTEWKRLPDRVLIAPYKFTPRPPNVASSVSGLEYTLGFETNSALPFPRNGEFDPNFVLPYVAFDPQGQLTSRRDELIALAEGSVFFPRDSQGRPKPGPPDVDIRLPRPPANPTNDTNNYNYLRISWLTGRASVDEATRPKFRD